MHASSVCFLLLTNLTLHRDAVVQPRNWNGTSGEKLDYSKPSAIPAPQGTSNPTLAGMSKSKMSVEDVVSYDDEDEAITAAIEHGAANVGSSKSDGVLSGLLSSLKTNVVGKDVLTASDLEPALGTMKKRLQERNVSSEVAERVCASVKSTLEGRKLASLTGVSSLVRSAMEQAITRILSPKRTVDLLADIRAAQGLGKPFSIVFVGVNGVGKSTSLAKVAYWLRQQKLRVMIAACDTFRYAF
jgi:signal recognition particle receptor subunit alpha